MHTVRALRRRTWGEAPRQACDRGLHPVDRGDRVHTSFRLTDDALDRVLTGAPARALRGRDALAELSGAIISWSAEIVLTVSLGTPWVVELIATRVASLTTRVGRSVFDVTSSAKALHNPAATTVEASVPSLH